MVHNYYSASQIFFALLDKTIGIRPHKPPPLYDSTQNASKCPSPQLPSSDNNGIPSRATASTVRLPEPEPCASPKTPTPEQVKNRRRTDSAFESVLAHRDPILPQDLEDEETEALVEDCVVDEWEDGEVDLIADLSWSDEAPDLKHLYYTRRHTNTSLEPPTRTAQKVNSQFQSFSLRQLFTFFHTLRLHMQKIDRVDVKLQQFVNLKELSLTGNYVEKVECENLPSGLEVLYLNANCISSFPPLSTLSNLVHISVSHNSITTLYPSSDTSPPPLPSKSTRLNTNNQIWWLPPSLMSLDVSWNLLTKISEVVDVVGKSGVRVFWCAGNPVSLLPSYRSRTILASGKLTSLDDVPITHSERVAAGNGRQDGGGDVDGEIALYFHIGQLSNIPQHKIDPPDGDQPPDEIQYQIDLVLPLHDTQRISTPPQPSTEPRIDFNFSTTAVFSVGKKVRDAIAEGVSVRLVRRRMTYVPRAPTADGVADPGKAAAKAPPARRPSNAGKAAGKKGKKDAGGEGKTDLFK
ncbi:Leucine-rich repeat-containing protein 43 [Rhizophlyctis rosea]|uniref:Leucine-rich repeat-containing protein 43 n=1 Tax=Rhizophlyctis rosea TaxID=64517 RepID=A0AAD5X330_9FUNG|nr:Leucine-rich repeat-containing protein 43 [Rhizophlyctis rosea]